MKKSKARLYIKNEISSNLMIYIKDKQYHYLKNVMRIKVNDTIRIFDGKTGEWLSLVLSINRNNIVLRVDTKTKNISEEPDVWLIFAPIKQHRMNMTVQKATELGASFLIPCLTEYTNIRLLNINNLKLNAIEAAEQSERLDIPKIKKPIEFNKMLNSWPEDRLLIFCDEKHSTEKNIYESLLELKIKSNKWAVLIGPEGGFSDIEKKIILNMKMAFPISLGKRLLRSDTAAMVVLFCIQELIRNN